MTGEALGRRLGVSQPTISRFERSELVPSVLDTGRLGLALGADPPTRRRLLELARTASEEKAGVVPVRVVLQIGVVNLQRRLRLREKRTHKVSTFHATIVPGLLQTADYMRSIAASRETLSPEEVDRWVAERLARQVQMREPGRDCTQLLTEGALAWGVAGAEVMAAQCEHIAELIDTTDWRIGVVPRVPRVDGPPVYPHNGFDLYDDAEVVLGLTAGNALVKDEHTLRAHLTLFARLTQIAVYGKEARALLCALADEYRALQ